MNSSQEKYPRPSVTADVLLFTVVENELKILLINRNTEPFKGTWALPGGFVKIDESLEDAAMRELKEEGNVDNVYLEQLFTFGDPRRDPRERVITVTYLALSDSKAWDLRSSGDAREAKLFSIKNLPKLAFDHRKIVDYGLERLRSKVGYSNIVLGLLPEAFTLTDLQNIYEVILGTKVDKRNFRKKILATGLLLPTGKKSDGKAHRPASYYKFKDRKLVITD